MQRRPEKAHESPGGAANSTRPRSTNLGIKFSSSPAVQRELMRRTEAGDTTQDGLSQRRKNYGSEPRREDRDESTERVDEESLEMSLEMSQQREPATGARGSDARSCYDSAGKTPPIPVTGRSAKSGISRVVPADHEVPG